MHGRHPSAKCRRQPNTDTKAMAASGRIQSNRKKSQSLLLAGPLRLNRPETNSEQRLHGRLVVEFFHRRCLPHAIIASRHDIRNSRKGQSAIQSNRERASRKWSSRRFPEVEHDHHCITVRGARSRLRAKEFLMARSSVAAKNSSSLAYCTQGSPWRLSASFSHQIPRSRGQRL